MKNIIKLFQHLAISVAIRIETMKWMAFVILAALGVVKEVKLEREDVLSQVINWLRWLHRAEKQEDSEITRMLAIKSSIGMRLMIRAP